MKQLFSFIAVIIAISVTSNAKAQCTPGNYSEPGIYPDTSTGLPPAVETQLYEQVITIVVPSDTTIEFGGIPTTVQVDSIGIKQITGLPQSIDYLPNTSTGYWAGGTSGCVLLTGTPTNSEIGTHSVIIEALIYASGFPDPYPYSTYYDFEVLDSTHVGVNENNIEKPIAAYPNPFDSKLTIEFETPQRSLVSIELFNVAGNKLKGKTIHSTVGKNTIIFNTNSLPKGMYFYRINTPGKIITRKLVKK
ncbi:MAG: T9SS type A sorting domain-containing protein [Bacteroidales bacterium]